MKMEDRMKIMNIPFSFTRWDQVDAVEHPGETGTSHWRVFSQGDLRVRVVDYSRGFRSDHWCPRGHVLLVLEGELTIDLKDGRSFKMPPLTSFQASDDESNPHLAYTEKGAKVFIVD
jgi:quercetin dioxygenase-like cupin family protein